MTNEHTQSWLDAAAQCVGDGGVIAYPTEFCFGLGCDPANQTAVERILQMKQRQVEQGLILIGVDFAQLANYVDFNQLEQTQRQRIISSWPGPNTWLVPRLDSAPEYISGKHDTIAVRVPDHQFCLALLARLPHALVSTSANRHAQAALLSASQVTQEFAQEVDLVIDLPVGGYVSASTIRHATSGEQIR